MPLYFRSDTRDPATIFAEGFKPKYPGLLRYYQKFNPEPWWMYALSSKPEGSDYELPNGDTLMYGRHDRAMDANPDYAVCMTTKLESAPIFPLGSSSDPNNETYIYVIALPEPSQPDFSNPHDSEIPVFNLHALQTQQSQNLLSRNPSYNALMATSCLCGYEAFAEKIEPEQIICAIKCRRTDAPHFALGLEVATEIERDRYSWPNNRLFQLDSHLFCNVNYVEKETGLKDMAISQLTQAAKKGVQPTTSVAEALDASGIAYDKNYLITMSLLRYSIQKQHSLLSVIFLSLCSLGGIAYTSLFRGMTLFDKTGGEIVVTNIDAHEEKPQQPDPSSSSASQFLRFFDPTKDKTSTDHRAPVVASEAPIYTSS